MDSGPFSGAVSDSALPLLRREAFDPALPAGIEMGRARERDAAMKRRFARSNALGGGVWGP